MAGILFIDAEQPFADQMVGVLRGKGFSVKLLDDGKDGLDFARDSRPDLIVLCVELPKMSGYSICNKLKKDNDLKGIPLIITSKEATPETFAQHKKLKTRAEDYLIKPFVEGDLIEKISAFVAAPGGGKNDDGFGALEALGADLDLGGSGNDVGGDSDIKLDDADFASLEPMPAKSASAARTQPLSDDDLLASLDDLGDLDSEKPSSLDDDFGELDALIQSDSKPPQSDSKPPSKPVTSPAPFAAPAPAPPPAPLPAFSAASATAPPSSASMPPTASADLQQLSQLRRESSDLKGKIAELEARLRAAEETSRAKDAQMAATASSTGGASSAREVLNLKEQLRSKDKEVSTMKDEVFEKEKANVDLQELIETVRREAQIKVDGAKQKDVELSAMTAKLKAVSEERDHLEEQVQGRLQQAEAERDQLRAEVTAAKGAASSMRNDLDRAKAFEDKLKMDLDRAKSEFEQDKKSGQQLRQAVETKLKEAEAEARTQEERALKAYQRLKGEETLRDKARQAAQIALSLLSGDVDTGKKEAVDLELDAE